jgi:hypothetical protein
MSRNGLISYEPERSLDALCSRTDSSSVTLLTIQVLKRKTPRANAGSAGVFSFGFNVPLTQSRHKVETVKFAHLASPNLASRRPELRPIAT